MLIPAASEAPYRVSALLPRSDYETVDVGGVTCPEFVEATSEYIADESATPCH